MYFINNLKKFNFKNLNIKLPKFGTGGVLVDINT